MASNTLESTVYARVGLIGNPSDGFDGAAIALSLQNFSATVTIEGSERIEFIPHPLHDPASFDNLEDLQHSISSFGYYGGLRLLMVRLHAATLSASLRVFWSRESHTSV
jgi:glucuronokinase